MHLLVNTLQKACAQGKPEPIREVLDTFRRTLHRNQYEFVVLVVAFSTGNEQVNRRLQDLAGGNFQKLFTRFSFDDTLCEDLVAMSAALGDAARTRSTGIFDAVAQTTDYEKILSHVQQNGDGAAVQALQYARRHMSAG